MKGLQIFNMIDKCKTCKKPLPAPEAEDRGEGYTELITICPNCGEEYYD